MRDRRSPSRPSSADATGQTLSKKAHAPRSKASDANRKRQERAPSPPSSADATGQALSKKARALARIRPFVHSFAASITAPAPAQQLKCQPLAFDDSSREAATASGLAIVKGFFEDRNMERSTCACCNELKPPSRTRTVSIEDGGSWLARIRTRLTWEHTTFACSAEVIDSTKRLYSSEAPLLAGIPLAPSGVAIDEQGSVEVRGRTIRSKALNAIDLLSHLLVPFRLHCALFATKVCVGGGLTRMRLPRPTTPINAQTIKVFPPLFLSPRHPFLSRVNSVLFTDVLCGSRAPSCIHPL